MRIQLDRGGVRFMLLAGFLTAMFLLGGSARDDAQSLVFLRPLSVIFLALGIALLPPGSLRENRLAIGLALALPLIILLHLLPLPPEVWRGLPGREFVWQIGEVTRIEQPWRPISLVPFRTWNSFWAMFAPLAAFVLALGVSQEQRRKTIYVVALIILASGVLGLLQSIGGTGNGFYLYQVTNADSAVGLFANRNHQAMLLAIAFPVVAAAASVAKGSKEAARPKLWLAIGAGVMIVPFLLVTNSRAGLLLGTLGIALALLVYRDPAAQLQDRRKTAKLLYRWAGFAVVAAGLALTVVLVGRESSLQRLASWETGEDLRFRVWGPIADAAWTYFPVGSGFGTFVETYKIIEPDAYLKPQHLNHAHNDWLEILLTGGVPALVLALAVIGFLGREAIAAFVRGPDLSHADGVMARLGAAILVILVLGSAYDYPLRVPSMASLFAVGAVWILQSRTRRKILQSPAERP